MHIAEIQVGEVVLLKRFKLVRKFKHRRDCNFKDLKYPVVRVSRIVGKNRPIARDPFGHKLWFKEMCACFPAAHVDIRVIDGKRKKINRKTSCPVRAYQVARLA